MKQSNLFDMFAKKSNKTPSQSQKSQSKPDDSQTEEKMSIEQSQNNNTNGNHNKLPQENEPITDEKPQNGTNQNSRKRKALIVEEEDEQLMVASPMKSTKQTGQQVEKIEELEDSLKKMKTSSTPVKTDSQKITVDIAKQFPKKDASKLKGITDPFYNAFEDAPFWKDEDVPFSFLVNTYDEVAKIKGEKSKEKIIAILANMFRSILILNPDQLNFAYFFSVLKICSDYEPQNQMGVGNEILVKAIAKSSGRGEKSIRQQHNKIGDLGKVAADSKASQSTMDKFYKANKKKNSATLKRVLENMRKLAKLRGANSNNDREATIASLLFDCKDEECKYVVRFIQGNLKIGAAEATMQAALVQAFVIFNYYNEEEAKPRNRSLQSLVPDYEKKIELYEQTIKRAICEYPNYKQLIDGLIRVGKDIEKLLEVCKITPGIPVKPMLAQPTKGIQIIFKRFENMKFTCEYKYDGLRGQIHYANGQCHLFSRNLENMTDQYPDIVDFVLKSTGKDTKNFIIDSEIVAISTETQKILPFQKLATRGRKNVDKNDIKIQVCLYVFDIMYYNDESLINYSLKERREYLKKNFTEVENKLKFAEYLDAETFEEVEGILTESIKVGCEGLMVKTLDDNAVYQPSKRSFNWLKLKKDYLDTGLGDSFDLVPIAAYYGTGKRTGLFGSFLLATYNHSMEQYETLCKTSTGFSDQQLEKFHKFFSDHIIPRPQNDYILSKQQEADVWFEPSCVWEIKGADIQISPIYTTAIGDADTNKGIGLRFPRLIRERDDKKCTEATDSAMICDIYKSQAAVMNDINFVDDDFY